MRKYPHLFSGLGFLAQHFGLSVSVPSSAGFRYSGSGFRRFRVPGLGFGIDQGEELESVLLERESVLEREIVVWV